MTPELASFSDWTLALLPRLFFYPGGLWLLAALLLRSALQARSFQAITPGQLLRDLSGANLLSTALAWAAASLVSLPGASALPSPVDTFVLAGLLVLSFSIDITMVEKRQLLPAISITLAIIIPTLGSRTLLTTAYTLTPVVVLSILAAVTGLLAMSWSGRSGLSAQVRWLGWLCLGLSPLWHLDMTNSPWWASAIVLGGIVVCCGLQVPKSRYEQAARWAGAIAWLPALLGLLLAIGAAS